MMPGETEYAGLVKPIRDDILQVDIPIKRPPKNFNLYIFKGEEPALIDTGPYHPFLEEKIKGAMRYAGLKEISRIILTHAHIDHSGMAAGLRAASGAEVVAHRLERPRLEDAQGHLRKEFECFSSLSGALGFPAPMTESIFGLAHGWMELYESCPVDVRLKGGESVRAGDRVLEAIHTPGHTAGHLCYYERSERLLFSGDHLMRAITPNPELYCPPRNGFITGLPQFLDSLRLLEGYDIACAYPGHGVPVKEARKRIEFTLLHHRRRMEKTLQAVQDGCRTVWEVAQRLFPQVRGTKPHVDQFLALKEALGHLSMLEEEGAVVRTEEDGLWIYTL